MFVKDYVKRFSDEELWNKYVWLPEGKHKVILILPQTLKDAALVMYGENEVMKYCVEFRGSGHYFKTAIEMERYLLERKFIG